MKPLKIGQWQTDHSGHSDVSQSGFWVFVESRVLDLVVNVKFMDMMWWMALLLKVLVGILFRGGVFINKKYIECKTRHKSLLFVTAYFAIISQL